MSFRDLQRPTRRREPLPLVVVAVDATRPESLYFEYLRPRPDIALHVLRIEGCQPESALPRVLSELAAWKRHQRFGSNDQAWVVADQSGISEAALDGYYRRAQNQCIRLALSNPCFELWLWLHVQPNRAFASAEHCRRAVSTHYPDWSRLQPRAARLIALTAPRAIERARRIDRPEDPWPKSQSTRVFRLVEYLLGSP